MNISYILGMLFAGVFVVLFLCAIYLLVYKRHINKALVEPKKKHIEMIPPYQVLFALIAVFAVIGTSFIITMVPGTERLATASDIEEDVRKIREVGGDWKVEIAMDDQLATAIAYDGEKSGCKFAIYLNDGKPGRNYVFRYGGSSTSIKRGVMAVTFEGKTAFISMNAPHIAAITCHDGETYEIDPNSPFVLIIPNGGFDVYGSNGNLINLEQDWWYEMREME